MDQDNGRNSANPLCIQATRTENHRAPTAGDTPAHTAASSLDCPAAMAAQNRRRSPRRATPGRPGDPNFLRKARSERRRPRHRITLHPSVATTI